MALFDGGPRSATCLANTRVCCAVLTRQAVEALTRDDPSTATRLLAAIAQRLSERLREADSKTRLFGQLVNTLQQEINLLMH
jgi:CRP-like cAMP-binding protein